MNRRCATALSTLLVAMSSLVGCATPSAYNDLAVEQDRCAGYWRRSGDPDRAAEMNRRANESRRVAASVDSSDNFFVEILVLILGGNRSPEPVKQAPHPSDPRGCEQ
jgi:hypothetical protein